MQDDSTLNLPRCQRCNQPYPIERNDQWCKECRRAYRVEYNQRNTEKIKEYTRSRKWEMQAATCNQRARDLGLVGNVTGDQLEALSQSSGGMCCHCNTTKNLTFDHIIALRCGGHSIIDNLQVLCRHCNRWKGPFGIDFRVKPPLIVDNPIGAIIP